jgi:hypothetical protein
MELIVAGTKGDRWLRHVHAQFSPWMGRDYLFLDDLYVRDEHGAWVSGHAS